MPTVGQKFSGAREAQNLTIEQVAEVTKIKTDHIRALDEGDYDVFSAPVYIRGFAKSYAKLLRLNVSELISKLDEELAQTEKFKEPPPLVGKQKEPIDFLMLQLSKLNWKLIAPASVVVLLLVFFFIFSGIFQNRTAPPRPPVGPGRYQSTNVAAVFLLPLPTNAPPQR